MSRRAVFLDRDGVLVENVLTAGHARAPISLDEFTIVAGAPREVARLRAAGLLPIVFTNQPEVARGTLSETVLARMHAALRTTVPVEEVLVCPHDGDACACRKPKPGMLVDAAARWTLDLAGCFVVGDRWRDIDAGRAVGCFTILIDRPWSACHAADARVESLGAAADLILEQVGG